jgi:hypothetical protein
VAGDRGGRGGDDGDAIPSGDRGGRTAGNGDARDRTEGVVRHAVVCT